MRKKLGRKINLVHGGEPPVSAGTRVFEAEFRASNETKNDVLERLLAALRQWAGVASQAEEAQMRLCLDEALVNAVMHGCEYDLHKTIRVQAFVDAKRWSVLVEDPGAGFREEDLPDPDAAENLLEESGRGVHLMRSLMDEVSYWRGGAALLLTRRRTTATTDKHR